MNLCVCCVIIYFDRMIKGFSKKLRDYVLTYTDMEAGELDGMNHEESTTAVSIRTALSTRMHDFGYHGSLRSDLPLTPKMAYVVTQHINQTPTPIGGRRCEGNHQQPRSTFAYGTSSKDMDEGTTQICIH